MKRLNERKPEYEESIAKLKEKCSRSNFDKKLINETIKNLHKCENEDERSTKKNKNKNIHGREKVVWATQFKNLIKLDKKEKELAPKAAVTYCKPETLGNLLKNYKKIANNNNNENTKPGSKKCKKCGLCGHHGKLENMVLETDGFNLENGEKIQIKQNLNCKSYGIYGARCKTCGDFYVGQTMRSFSQRWNSHRSYWNKMIKGNNWKQEDQADKNEKRKDEQALFYHFIKKHKNLINNNLNLTKAYELLFLENTNLQT